MIYSLCFILKFPIINIKQNNKKRIYPRSKIGMEEGKEYKRIIPRIGYYIKIKNIERILKKKCPLFAAGGKEERINLFSNSLEHMGYFSGHKLTIYCLCAMSKNILASGSGDKTIKIWNIEDRSIISTLSGHSEAVNVLCSVKEGVLVSGSVDKSLIIWSLSTPESATYSLRQTLTGHKSRQTLTGHKSRQTLTGHKSSIGGIIRLSNTEIVSGDKDGD